MLKKIYNSLWFAALPFAYARLIWRSRKAPDYRQRLLERVGFYSDLKTGGIWIHAVSVGEVLAAVPVIQYFLEKHPERVVTVTTMTPTGSARVKAVFADRVQHVYLPYDLMPAVSRFLDQLQPCLGVVIETELWPNLFHAAKKRKIPVVVANARLSAKSAKGYARISSLTKGIFHDLSLIVAQGHADADRFKSLGLPANKVAVTGSIKFDIEIAQSIREEAHVIKQQLGDRPVFIAASTHQGEDAFVIDAYKQIQKTIPNLLLLLVPRHPERFNEVAKQCQDAGLSVARRSCGESPVSETNVYLGDTMGELKKLFAVADVAFVGGSFKAVGGHNILEPIALHVPTIVGPHMFNFAEITKMMLEAEGLLQTKASASALAAAVLLMLEDKTEREHVVNNASRVLEQNRGALDRLCEILEQTLIAREQ